MASLVYTFGSGTGNRVVLGDYYVYNPPTYDDWYATNVAFAQGFILSATTTLDSVQVRMRRWGDGAPPSPDVAGTVRASVHSLTPDGIEIDYGTVDRTTIGTTSQVVTFTFVSSGVCTSGVQYYLVIDDPTSIRDARGGGDYDVTWLYITANVTLELLKYDGAPICQGIGYCRRMFLI